MALRDLDVDIQFNTDASPIDRLNNTLERLSTQISETFGNLRNASDDIDETTDNLDDLGDSSRQSRMNILATGAGAMAVGGQFKSMGDSILGAFKDAAQTGMDFQAQMAKVGTIAGATKDEMKALTDTAIQLGADTPKSASEVAIAMQELAAKGFDANKTIAAMPGIISASVASGEDLAMTSDVITSALNAFNFKASESGHIADVMAMSANATAAGVQDLGYSFKYAAPVANTLKIKMEELAAATGMMVDKGLAGEQAGTSLRMGLMRLSNAPKKAQKAMDKLGFSAVDSTGKFKSLAQISDELREKTKGMTQAQKVQTLGTIFGVEAATGWLDLVDSAPGKLQKMTNELIHSNGSSEKAAKQMMDNSAGALEQLSGAVESFKLKIQSVMEGPMKNTFTTIGNGIDKVTQAFGKLPSSVQSGLLLFALLIGVLLTVGGVALVTAGGFGILAGGLGLTAAGLWAVMWPVLAVIAAIALIAAAVYVLWNKFEWFRNGVKAAWDWIVSATVFAFNAIKAAVMPAIQAVVSFFQAKFAEIQAFWNQYGAQIIELVKLTFNNLKTIIQGALTVIKGVFQVVWPIITSIVKVAWNTIKLVINTAISLVKGIITTGLALIKGDWSGAWNHIKGTAVEIMNNIVGFFKNIDLFSIGKNIIQGLIKGIGSMVGAVKDTVSGIVKNVTGTFTKLLGIHSPSVVFEGYGINTGQGYINGIDTISPDVKESTQNMGVGITQDYTPENSVTTNNTRNSKSVVFSPKITVQGGSSGSNKNVKQQVKEALDEAFSYWNDLYSSEVAY